MTPDLRNRVLSRSVMLRLGAIRPYYGSLERDPIHPSAIYVAVDGIEGEPLLLRLAPNATPSSGLFPKSILIGRVPGPGGLELVVNAIPFGHGNAEAIGTFAKEVNRAFQGKPAGMRSAIVVESKNAETVYPAALEVFRRVLVERNLNMAGFTDGTVGSWAAIRAGWREGFVVNAKDTVAAEKLTERQRAVCKLEIDDAAQAAERIERCSQFLL